MLYTWNYIMFPASFASIKKKKKTDFPSGPVAKSYPPNAGGSGTRFHMPQLRIYFAYSN